MSYAPLAALLGAFVLYLLVRPRKNGIYPPGPKGHPFVGHTFQVPTTQTWRYFEKLSHKYGMLDSARCASLSKLLMLHIFRANRQVISRRKRHCCAEQACRRRGTRTGSTL